MLKKESVTFMMKPKCSTISLKCFDTMNKTNWIDLKTSGISLQKMTMMLQGIGA